MKKESYYTPELSEFYVGFEYEAEVKRGSDQWMNLTLGEHIENWDRIFNAIDTIRVKQLDTEDIISLGWEKSVDEKSFYYGNEKQFELYIASSGRITISNNDNVNGVFHHGIIRNKSELKKLMQQLQIR